MADRSHRLYYLLIPQLPKGAGLPCNRPGTPSGCGLSPRRNPAAPGPYPITRWSNS